MKKNYNNKNRENRDGGERRENRDGNRNHGRSGERREGRDGGERRRYDNNNPKFQKNDASASKSEFQKNPMGFLVISLFVKAKTDFNIVADSIESAMKIDSKKKIVISFEDKNNKSLISSIKKKFEGAFGVFFYTPKGKMKSNSTLNSSMIHTEVLNSFKSNFFLTLDANITVREFSIEKMIGFLCKPGDVLAVSPKFYSLEKEIIHNCKRFFALKDFLPSSESKKKTLADEHFMMERGEVGYYSIHRVDYGNLDCMLFLTDALLKIKSFSCFSSQDLRDAMTCKNFSKKTKGKIMFYPHARVLSSEPAEEKPSTVEKIKYLLASIF
jgi:hypothetical protein